MIRVLLSFIAGGIVVAAFFIVRQFTGDLTPCLVEEGTAIEFNTPGGVRVLRYGELYAYDTTGRPLLAHLTLASSNALNAQHAIRITIDDTNAVYPVTVDPLAVCGS